MPLLIEDAEVDRLAEELQRLTHAPSTTEAVRAALRAEIERLDRTASLRERVKRSQAMARAIGEKDPNFDLKAFRDEMWGDL